MRLQMGIFMPVITNSGMRDMNDEAADRPGASDILSTMRGEFKNLSETQQRIAQLFLDAPDWAVTAPVEELATRAGVSAPTVVRFARAVGCAGLKDLKLKIAGALALGAPFLHRAVHVSDTTGEIIQNIVGSVTTVLAEWQRRIKPSDFASAAEAISRAGRIDCLGTGSTSHFIALDLQARLFRLGLNATTFTDAHFQLVAAATLQKNDVVVAISFVGRMPTLLKPVELARSRGATVIALTESSTPLAQLADIILPVDVPGDATMLVGTDAYVVQLLCIEILMILVGMQRGPKLGDRLAQIQQALLRFGADVGDATQMHEGWQQMFASLDE